MKPLFQIPEDLSALSVEELEAFITGALETVDAVTADPSKFATDGRTPGALTDELSEGVATIEAARAVLASREKPEDEIEEPEAVEEIDADELAELAARAHAEPEVEELAEPEPVAAVTEPETAASEPEELAAEPEPKTEPVTAAAPAPARRLRRPARRQSAEPVVEEPRVALTAAADNLGPSLGAEIDTAEFARMAVKRRAQFGNIAPGTHGEKIPLARASWSDMYGDERSLGSSDLENQSKIEAVVASALIRAAMEERKKDGSLTASAPLCAPVTPYYNLMQIAQADRPVRDALAAFNADRGGIRVAAPAGLGAVTSGVGIITESQVVSGGSDAVKVCQVVACPQFSEVDVSSIYHCIQFDNLGARVFPELLAQWNELVLAMHARVAETALLDGIAGHSTHVTASNLGLGASATLPSQIITAANGIRSRNRMNLESVLRVMLPAWVLDLLVSDVYRTQFDRFEMTRDQFVAVLRAANVEPTFYLDGTTGGGQVFGHQAASDLLSFPPTIEWFIYPEGSFLYLDGGTLELGLVRDSILNSTNDFQLFGETWENVAFIGVESLKVTTTTCDSGAVSQPVDSGGCPVDYAG